MKQLQTLRLEERSPTMEVKFWSEEHILSNNHTLFTDAVTAKIILFHTRSVC